MRSCLYLGITCAPMVNTEELTLVELSCTHCGLQCNDDEIFLDDNIFCCEGCKMVYSLINESGLCNYYNLNEHPGINRKDKIRENKFSFLDDQEVVSQLISFQNQNLTHVTFYLPAIHCSSCLYLLENIHKFNSNILSCEIHFTKKEAKLVYEHNTISLREVAELLTRLGYEPYISLKDVKGAKPRTSKSMIYKLGIAGFCFSNIMMMSFPEYLGLHDSEKDILGVLRFLNFALAVPTFFYSALPFFQSAWAGIRSKFLNIDAPISLAIIVTFTRSIYEIATHTGGGYFDSMAGIIFFMLLGRILQDKTYQHLEFDRDYTSYFPISVITLVNEVEKPIQLASLKKGDLIRIHNEEVIPVDCILSKGRAYIDYSFVTGESEINRIETGEIVYAGGKQIGAAIDLLIVKDVSQSYLTQLWKQSKVKTSVQQDRKSFIHFLSRYFSYIVFSISFLSGLYWYFNDSTMIFKAATAVLIVACPCALLLSNTFANGFVLRILGYNDFYLKDALSIEFISGIKQIVFDKTGTLTEAKQINVVYEGITLNSNEKVCVAALTKQSKHPLSKAVFQVLNLNSSTIVDDFKEFPGEGIEGTIGGCLFKIGSDKFVGNEKTADKRSSVGISINGKFKGSFFVENKYRAHAVNVIKDLNENFKISVLSGDNDNEASNLRQMLGAKGDLRFNQKPEDKLNYIKHLQAQGISAMMIGDGLNDAGALMQSDVGIAIAENNNNFTPASDVILSANSFQKLPSLLKLCKDGKRIIVSSFIISILYNLIGIYFSVKAMLSPLIAAILMPASTFSIIIFTFTATWIMAKRRKLQTIRKQQYMN